jgi:hypothetical protein
MFSRFYDLVVVEKAEYSAIHVVLVDGDVTNRGSKYSTTRVSECIFQDAHTHCLENLNGTIDNKVEWVL